MPMKKFDVETPEKLTPNQKRSAVGILAWNTRPQDARLYDLIGGEEIGNEETLDLTRLQNLFFTLVLVGVYAVSLSYVLVDTIPISEFPELGSSAVTLLGISSCWLSDW